MENIAIRVRQNDPNAAQDHGTDEGGAEKDVKYGKLEQKVIDEMW